MSKTLRLLGLAILFMGVAAVAAADSHEPSVYVWINFIKAKPGMSEALTSYLIEEGMKNYDPLVESGAVADWGVAMPVIHDGNDPASHIEWISFVGWDGADQFMSAFMASRETMSPEEMKAVGEKWASLVVPGSHSDAIHRSIGIGELRAGRSGYIHLAYFSAKPGKAAAVQETWDEFAAPVYDQVLADGKILNYGLHVPAVHRGESYTHMSWYLSETLAARDAVGAAFDAAEAARSEEEAKAWQEQMMEIFEREHEDQILMVIHHKLGSPAAE